MTKPYVVTKQAVVAKPFEGMNRWIELAVKHSDKSLWNNGSFVVRDVRGKPGIISNHARGLAVDLSYRWMSQKELGRQDGRKIAMSYLVKLLEHADTLGIQLVIDYNMKRSWKCDRGTWQAGNFEMGDWFHIECDPELIRQPEAVKQAWAKVFTGIPQTL